MRTEPAQPESGFAGCLLSIKDWVISGMICVFVVMAWASFLEMLTPLMPIEEAEARIVGRQQTQPGGRQNAKRTNYRLQLQFPDGTGFSTLAPKETYQWSNRAPVLVARIRGTSKLVGISKADRSESHSLLSGGVLVTLLIMVLPSTAAAGWLFWKVHLSLPPGVDRLRLPVFFICLVPALVGGTLWWMVD